MCVVTTSPLRRKYSCMLIVSAVVNKGGLGKPIATLTPAQLSTFLKLLMVAMVTYASAITWTRLSLIVMYRRIFDTIRFRNISSGLIILCLLWWIIAAFGQIFMCRPVAAFFDPTSLTSNQCMDIRSFLRGMTIANVFLDAGVLCFPIYKVNTLQLQRRQKLMLSSIFLMGGL